MRGRAGSRYTARMATLGSGLLTLLSFAVLISVVVFFHELGHLWVARRMGVKALKLSIGFGPKVFSFTRGGTEYLLSALPFGGYVKFAGDNPYEEVPPEHKGHGFLEASPGARAAIAFAGPGANFVLAFVIFFGLSLLPIRQPAPVIGFVKPGSPAAHAGLRAYDRVRSIDGQKVRSFLDLQEHVQRAAGRPVDFVIERDGKPVDVRVVPASVELKTLIETVQRGRIGISAWPRAAIVATLGPAGIAAQGGLRAFDKVTMFEGQPVKSYEHLMTLLGRRMSTGAASFVQLQGLRAAGEAKTEAFRATLQIPARAPQALSLEDTEQALGLVSADRSIASVADGSPAQQAGLLRGDRVVALDGKQVLWWDDDVEPVRRAAGERPLTFTVLREGQTLDVKVAQRLEEGRDEYNQCAVQPVLGAHLDAGVLQGERELVSVRFGPGEAARRSVVDTADSVRQLGLVLYRMVTGDIPGRAVSGPLMIADVAKQAAEAGWQVFLATIALISMNLGVMNLLPVPILDGFHILSAAIEGVRRRAPSLRFREISSMIGLAMVLALMVFALTNDVRNKLPCGKEAAASKG